LSRKKDSKHGLFDQAYDKAEQKIPLTPTENLELLRYLYPRPLKIVPCDKCGHGTNDKDRSKDPRWNFSKEERVCGPCCYGKEDFWTDYISGKR